MFVEKPLNTSTSTAETKARKYYIACMDANKTIEKLGAKPLLDLLKDVGGWKISTKYVLNSQTMKNNV